MRVHITRCERHLIKLGYFCPGCQHACAPSATTWKVGHSVRCVGNFSTNASGHQYTGQSQSPRTNCLNLYALGEQWIEEVTEVDFVATSLQGSPEGEHLKFKAHVRGWRTEARERRCQSLLGIKAKHNLRRALLGAQWKDVLLVPQAR